MRAAKFQRERSGGSVSAGGSAVRAACLALIAVTATTSSLHAQSGRRSWDDFDLVQFITVSGSGPSSILRLDDNGELLLRAETGVAEDELRAAAGAAASQIALLEAWQLLERSGDTLRTTFPILDERETRALRTRTRAAAPAIVDEIAEDVRRLRRELAHTGRSANTYAILFSYVLDGLTWTAWEEAGVIPEREITVGHPFWSGEIWAVNPQRPALVGTNRISDERGALIVTWSYEAIRTLGPFITEFGKVIELFDSFADGTPVQPELGDLFEPYDVLDEAGGLSVPVIETRTDDPVHALASRIAGTVADRAPDALELAVLEREFGFRDEAQALVIGFHELMWDILAILDRRGLVARPPVLDGEAEEPADAAALIFGVR